MSVSYVISAEHDLVLSVWDGQTSHAEWMENLRRLLNDPGYPRAVRHLADVRSGSADETIQKSEVTSAASMLQSVDKTSINRKIAIVAGIKDFDKLKIFERTMTSSSTSVVVFNHFSSACGWLGIDPAFAETACKELLNRMRSSHPIK